MLLKMAIIPFRCYHVSLCHYIEALGRLGGLTITSIEAIKDKSKLPEEQGFICNSSSHWFTIRKIGGVWYNLNSTNKKMPEIVS